MDLNGNINAIEGVDLCVCGCKYWECDKCMNCGLMVEQVRIRRLADVSRYMNEVKLNVMVTTMVHYRLPWLRDAPITDLVDITARPITDLVDITARHRAAGHIQ